MFEQILHRDHPISFPKHMYAYTHVRAHTYVCILFLMGVLSFFLTCGQVIKSYNLIESMQMRY